MEQLLSSRAIDWREGRRLRAWELHEAGWTQAEIAEALGVTPGAVSQWMRRGREGGGIAALNKRSAPGAACKLSPQQRAQLLTWLDEGLRRTGSAMSYGRANALRRSSRASSACTTPRACEQAAAGVEVESSKACPAGNAA